MVNHPANVGSIPTGVGGVGTWEGHRAKMSCAENAPLYGRGHLSPCNDGEHDIFVTHFVVYCLVGANRTSLYNYCQQINGRALCESAALFVCV